MTLIHALRIGYVGDHVQRKFFTESGYGPFTQWGRIEERNGRKFVEAGWAKPKIPKRLLKLDDWILTDRCTGKEK